MNILLVSVIVLIYLIVTGLLGYLGWKNTKDEADYLLAGRKTHPVIMAVSYGATFISTSAIVGFGGAAAVFGMGILWLTFLNIGVGVFIAFVFFGKRTRKMGHNLDAHTFPELIGKRYDSKFLQVASGLLIFIAMPLYAGSVIIGGAQFIAQTFSINYDIALFFFVGIVALYVVMGGLKGVMYTDAFQGTIMFFGMLFLLIFTYAKLGGVTAAHRELTGISDEAIKIWGKAGHQGWTDMPVFGSVFWWQLVSTIIMGVGIGVLAQPQLAVRFMTVKSDRELNRGVLIGGVFILMMTGVGFIVGALTNVYFYNNPDFAAISIMAAGKSVDNIIPLYITSALPSWFTAIFMITLLAAAMSTLSSQFHTMGTSFGRDFMEKGLGVKSKNSLLSTKLSMSAAILVSAVIAYFLPMFFEQGSAIIAIGTAIFFGLCASTFLPLYLGGLFSKKITKEAAIAGFFTGLVLSIFWLVFVHSKESAPLGICNAIFGVPSLGHKSNLQYVDPLFIALPASAAVTAITAFFTKNENTKHLEKCFDGIKT